MTLPFLTAHLAGVGGRVKVSPDDFRVDEIPLYPADGQGDHVYFQIRKIGVATPIVIERIARYMNVRPADIGLAGLKDAQATATQWLSLEHADAKKLAGYRDQQTRVIAVTRHANKLRPGHLAGNRFAIRIRGVDWGSQSVAETILAELVRRGVPNYFGIQRFGKRNDTDLLGAALIRDDPETFLSLYLGRPNADDPTDCRKARQAFDDGDLERALAHWPRHYQHERRALSALKRRRPAAAIATIDKRMRRFYVSACQSRIFNDVVAARIETIDRLLPGDLAQKADTGGVFAVEDAAAEQPRSDARQISPTGPILGTRCRMAEGEPGRIEREALSAAGLAVGDFDRVGSLKIKGGRRALRFFLVEPRVTGGNDADGTFLEVQFTAPSGCYATVALREITKNDQTD